VRYRIVKCVKLRTDMESSMRTSPTYWLSRMQEGERSKRSVAPARWTRRGTLLRCRLGWWHNSGQPKLSDFEIDALVQHPFKRI
jgi:hypothetical protein